MNLTMKESISIPDSVLFRNLDGEAVILNLDNEMYFGLDDVGVHMWTQLTTKPNIQEAYEALIIQYEVEPELLRKDLEDLIEELVNNGLLELSSS